MIRNAFGPTVRTLREGAKLSQSVIAQALSMNRMYYSLFEAGRYVLDDDEERALRAFLSTKGVELPTSSEAERPDEQYPEGSDSLPSQDDDLDDDNRTQVSASTLELLGELAAATGIDSKRTAAAVVVAAKELDQLDFAELVALAAEMDAPTDGLIDESSFELLPIEQKLVWESRAAGMLICSALYGAQWKGSTCSELRLVRESLRKRFESDCWHVRECGLFETDQKYLGDLRCQLAPYIALAAQQRYAAALSAN